MTVAVLAAGASIRFGEPKQLASYGSETLISHAVRTAAASGANRVLVVLGSNAEAIAPEVPAPATILLNETWEEGMASSIRLAAEKTTDDILLITLCDQPLVTAEHLRLLAELAAEHPIVATRYGEVLGVPCAFRSEVFPLLNILQGEEGARNFIRSTHAGAASVPFDGATVDVDTPEDLHRLPPA